jgi:hypothetical protein
MAALLGLWLILPWNASATRLRKLAAPGFLLMAFALGMTGSGGAHFPIGLIGFAAVALVYGMAVTAATMIVLGGHRGGRHGVADLGRCHVDRVPGRRPPS